MTNLPTDYIEWAIDNCYDQGEWFKSGKADDQLQALLDALTEKTNR